MSNARAPTEATVSLCPGGTMRNHLTAFCVIATTLVVAACTDGTGSRGMPPVSLAVSGGASAMTAAAPQAAATETFSDGTSTLVISSVEVVLRKVVLKRAGAAEPAGCAMSTSGIMASDDGACDDGNDQGDELEAGPAPGDLPLGGIERAFTAGGPPGALGALRVPNSKPRHEAGGPAP